MEHLVTVILMEYDGRFNFQAHPQLHPEEPIVHIYELSPR